MKLIPKLIHVVIQEFLFTTRLCMAISSDSPLYGQAGQPTFKLGSSHVFQIGPVPQLANTFVDLFYTTVEGWASE